MVQRGGPGVSLSADGLPRCGVGRRQVTVGTAPFHNLKSVNDALHSVRHIFSEGKFVCSSTAGVHNLTWMRGDRWWPGCVVISIGCAGLLSCVRDFYRAGKGTWAPWDPPKHLVVIGLYRHVRNPMYVCVLLLIFGWAIYFSSRLIVAYAILLSLAFHLRIVLYEEPILATQSPLRGTHFRRMCDAGFRGRCPGESSDPC